MWINEVYNEVIRKSPALPAIQLISLCKMQKFVSLYWKPNVHTYMCSFVIFEEHIFVDPLAL